MEEDLVKMAILTRQANQMHEMDKDEPGWRTSKSGLGESLR